MLFRMFAPKPLKKARRLAHPVSLVTPRPVQRAKMAAVNTVNPIGGAKRAVKSSIVRGVRSSGGVQRQRSQAPDGLPARFTQRWIEETVPHLDQQQLEYVIAVMRQRGWTDDDLSMRVLPCVGGASIPKREEQQGSPKMREPAPTRQTNPEPPAEADEYTRVMELLDLQDHLDKSMIPRLRGLVDDPTPTVRRTAADYLHELRADGIQEVLIKQLDDPDEGVRTFALLNLQDHLDELLVPRLRALVGDPTPTVRRTAADYLSELRVDGIKDVLLKQLDDPDEGVRTFALLNLQDHLDKSMIPRLRLLLDDPTPTVRRTTADYLSELRAEGVKDILVKQLDDPDESVRTFAQLNLDA